jgi:hypothetical protein
MVHSLSKKKRRNCLNGKEIGADFTPGRCEPKSVSGAKRALKTNDFLRIMGRNQSGRHFHAVSSLNSSCPILVFSLSFPQDKMKTASTLLPVLLLCLCLTGCASLQNLFKRKDPLPPNPLGKQPTLEQITSGINRNSQLIRNFTTENASIHIPGVMIPLHSRLTFERPKRLRIQGSVSSLGNQEFDFGSNDDIFWLWTRKGTNEMWYCRHDQYHISPVRATIPIDPDWLIEALGIVEFKPTDQHFGPTQMSDGNWEIVSHCQTPSGQYVKRTVIDSKAGWLKRLELYTPQNELVALADVIDSKFDRGTGIYYVKRVSVQCQGMEGTMTIDLGSPTFNTSTPFASTMFMMPPFDGYRAVDLGGPEIMQHRGVVMPPLQMPNIPEASIQTVIR